MAKIRIGYVGCGFMAQKVHIPNILLTEGCELAAVAEVRPELGKRVQARFGIPKLYSDHKGLAKDKSLDAAAVSGHFAGQGELAIDLLRAGKDVFMEKPMAVSVAQAERILEAEKESGRRLMVAYMKRYDGGNVLVKEEIDRMRESGELGEIRFARNHGFCGDWTAGLDVPFETTDEPKPATDLPEAFPSWMPMGFRDRYVSYLQQYTHNVNLLRWFLRAGDDVKVRTVDLDGEDGVSGVVILEMGGVRTVIESGRVKYHAWEEHTQVYFEGGWIKTWAPPLLLRSTPAPVEIYSSGQTRSVFPESGWTWSYKEEMRHFVECLQTGAPFHSTAEDTMGDVRTMEEIYRRFVDANAEPSARGT